MKLAICFLTPLVCLAQDPVIRTEVRLINLAITATDAATGQLTGDLTRDDLEILEDGVPQKIEFFNRGADVDLNLAIVMDISGSQEKFVKRHRRDIRTFLDTTLRNRDRAMIGGFGSKVRLVHDFSQDSGALLDSADDYKEHPARFPALGPAISREGGSAVYDGLFHTIEEKLAKLESGRKALLLFSDGEDNASAHHMLDVLEAAQSADVVIYGIHYLEAKARLTSRNLYGRSVMQRLARDTGGESFEAEDELKQTFAKIASQLRTSYQAAYRSSNNDRPGSFRNITVVSKRPGVRLRHRNGYFVR